MADFDRLEQALAMSLVNHLGISFTQAVDAVRKQAIATEACGWALVPQNATEEMIDANCDDGFGPVNVAGPYRLHHDVQMDNFYLNIPQLERMWRAMVAARPKLSASAPSEENT